MIHQHIPPVFSLNSEDQFFFQENMRNSVLWCKIGNSRYLCSLDRQFFYFWIVHFCRLAIQNIKDFWTFPKKSSKAVQCWFGFHFKQHLPWNLISVIKICMKKIRFSEFSLITGTWMGYYEWDVFEFYVGESKTDVEFCFSIRNWSSYSLPW